LDPTTLWLVIAVVAIVVIAAAFVTMSRRRSARLRQRFGTEYDHAVHTEKNVRRAEAALEARAKRVEALHIRPLVPEDRRDSTPRGAPSRLALSTTRKALSARPTGWLAR